MYIISFSLSLADGECDHLTNSTVIYKLLLCANGVVSAMITGKTVNSLSCSFSFSHKRTGRGAHTLFPDTERIPDRLVRIYIENITLTMGRSSTKTVTLLKVDNKRIKTRKSHEFWCEHAILKRLLFYAIAL